MGMLDDQEMLGGLPPEVMRQMQLAQLSQGLMGFGGGMLAASRGGLTPAQRSHFQNQGFQAAAGSFDPMAQYKAALTFSQIQKAQTEQREAAKARAAREAYFGTLGPEQQVLARAVGPDYAKTQVPKQPEIPWYGELGPAGFATRPGAANVLRAKEQAEAEGRAAGTPPVDYYQRALDQARGTAAGTPAPDLYADALARARGTAAGTPAPDLYADALARARGTAAGTPAPDLYADALARARGTAAGTPAPDLYADALARAAGTAAGTPTKDPALQFKIDTIMRTQNVDEQTAAGIATGAVSIVPDQTYGGYHIVDRGKNTSRYVSGAEPGPAPSGQAQAPGAPSATKPPIQFPEGVGVSGLAGWVGNTASDLFGGKLPAPEAEKAWQGLTNLQIRTQTSMQASIPGRPAVYLMEQLKRLSVDPGSLTQGPKRAYERLSSTRDMLREEIARMETDILANPGDFSRKEISDTRANRSQLKTILKNYDTVIESFDNARKENERPRGNVTPEQRNLLDLYK
jgi:hypothetical protein